jgi:hypothetical protein
MATLTIEERYHGPPDAGHGGYSSGVIAQFVPADTVQVTLLKPVPLERALDAESSGEVLRVADSGTPIAEATPSDTDVTADLPPPVTYQESVLATIGYVGYKSHPTPTCLVCGIQREAGDGLRLFAGPMRGKKMVAAPWVPDLWVTGKDGGVRPEMIWAALDCPGGWALTDFVPGKLARLGTMTARLMRPVEPGKRYVVAGWPLGSEGRKLFCGTVVYDDSGAVCAAARSTWVQAES